MEKKLSSFQIKYESLSKAHAFLVSQNRNMKVKLYFLFYVNFFSKISEEIASGPGQEAKVVTT